MTSINWQEVLKDKPEGATHYFNGDWFFKNAGGHTLKIDRAGVYLPCCSFVPPYKIPTAEIDKFNASVSKKESVAKTYTQEMADNGVPNAGDRVFIHHSAMSDGAMLPVLIKFIDDEVVLYSSLQCGKEYEHGFAALSQCTFYAGDTRTEKEKVIDEIEAIIGCCPTNMTAHDIAVRVYDKFINGGE